MDEGEGILGVRNEEWEKIIAEFKEPLMMIDGPLKMANLFAQTMANAKSAELDVKIPLGAEEWAEVVFARWFELMGKIAKASGARNRLLDRELYEPLSDNSPDWAEGLTLEDLPRILDDDEVDYIPDVDDSSEILEGLYGPFGDEPGMMFGLSEMETKKLERRLSGQYNRLFPVKLVLRTAASLIASRDEYKFIGQEDGEYEYEEILLEDLRKECLKVAQYAKSRFKWIDARARSGISMGERLSVGLPDRKGEAKKVRKQAERFVSQFVGSVRNKGQGLPFELGLLSVDDEGEVLFTENGVRFMLLSNPLFDTLDAWRDGESFSEEEKLFLIKMIHRNVPDEFAFMQQLVGWIGDGHDRPKMIEEKISAEYGSNVTETSLVRSGTLARMIELGLVSRIQSGRNVTYSLTENGKRLRSN